jgi:hypothetical protein
MGRVETTYIVYGPCLLKTDNDEGRKEEEERRRLCVYHVCKHEEMNDH